MPSIGVILVLLSLQLSTFLYYMQKKKNLLSAGIVFKNELKMCLMIMLTINNVQVLLGPREVGQ